MRQLLVQLYDDMIRVMPGEDEAHYSRFYFSDQVTMRRVMTLVLGHLLTNREKIEKKDKTYFFSEHLFRVLRVPSQDCFRKLFSSKVTKNNENVVWLYCHNILEIADRYAKVLGLNTREKIEKFVKVVASYRWIQLKYYP